MPGVDVADVTGAVRVPVCATPLPDAADLQYAAAWPAVRSTARKMLSCMSSPRRNIRKLPSTSPRGGIVGAVQRDGPLVRGPSRPVRS